MINTRIKEINIVTFVLFAKSFHRPDALYLVDMHVHVVGAIKDLVVGVQCVERLYHHTF